MKIILTNDDGIWAPGLHSLEKALRSAGHDVHVVAPRSQQSAVGHAVTLSSPLRIKKVKENHFNGYAISGTPVDCVKIALGTVLSFEPDILISGINNGPNVGVDVLYSGTVSAATEAALANIPALAVSINEFHPRNLSEHANYVVEFVESLNWKELPPRRVLNLNFPYCNLEDSKGLKICPQTQAVYEDWYDERVDPRGTPYYWLCGEILPENLEPNTDKTFLDQGYITLTPLTFDFTDYELLEKLNV